MTSKEQITEQFTGEHYYIKIDKPVIGTNESNNDALYYLVINKHTNVVEVETSILPQALASMKEMDSMVNSLIDDEEPGSLKDMLSNDDNLLQ